MRRLSVLLLAIFVIFSILILPPEVNSVTSKTTDNQVGYIHNAFVVKLSSDVECINLKAEKMIVLTGVWQIDALNQYFRVDIMEPVSPWKTTQSEIPAKSRYYLLKCHPLVSLNEVMDVYESLSFVDNVELLNKDSKFFFYPEDHKSESIKDKTDEPANKPLTGIPFKFSMSQNYPNPFNARTSFTICLPEETHVNLTIYNVVGQKVKTLVNDYMSAGTHVMRWDGSNESGQEVSSAMYFYRIVTQENVATRKMILMK